MVHGTNRDTKSQCTTHTVNWCVVAIGALLRVRIILNMVALFTSTGSQHQEDMSQELNISQWAFGWSFTGMNGTMHLQRCSLATCLLNMSKECSFYMTVGSWKEQSCHKNIQNVRLCRSDSVMDKNCWWCRQGSGQEWHNITKAQHTTIREK